MIGTIETFDRSVREGNLRNKLAKRAMLDRIGLFDREIVPEEQTRQIDTATYWRLKSHGFAFMGPVDQNPKRDGLYEM